MWRQIYWILQLQVYYPKYKRISSGIQWLSGPARCKAQNAIMRLMIKNYSQLWKASKDGATIWREASSLCVFCVITPIFATLWPPKNWMADKFTRQKSLQAMTSILSTALAERILLMHPVNILIMRQLKKKQTRPSCPPWRINSNMEHLKTHIRNHLCL